MVKDKVSAPQTKKTIQKRRLVDLTSIGVVVFLADAAWGMIFSTLSLYAMALKASVALIGIIVSSVGLSRTLGSLPSGMLSDRIGRKPTIIMGLVAILIGSISLIVVLNPLQLVLAAMLIGFGVSAVFPIGFAYVSDFIGSRSKGEAIGVYATFMGMGFSVGPVVGGLISENWGYTFTYITSSLLLLICLVIAWKTLKKRRKSQSQLNTSMSLDDLLENLISVKKKRETMVASIAIFFYAICFSTIFGFFPLYAEKIGLNLTLIGSIITARIFFSTIVRLPVGMLTKKINSVILMILALVSPSILLFIIPLFDSYYPLLVILSLEGICFGTFLVSSNTLIAETSEEHERGAAMGLFTTSESIGATVGPLILGMIGGLWGLNAVFRIASILVIVGVLYLGTNRKVLSHPKIA